LQPIAELELTTQVFDQARRDVSAALVAPPDRRVINLLVGAEACRRCGELPADWLATLTALVGAPWKETLPPTARLFVDPRRTEIQRMVAELLYERRVLVSRAMAFCSVRAE
jgi:hypothetical protein